MTDEKIDGGKLGETPNDKYAKFFKQFGEIDTTSVEQWKVVHLLGYFCKQFQSTYNTDYQFKYNSPNPSKSFEIFQLKKLGQVLSSKPKILKEYIDWVFADKAGKEKIRFRSISFLTREEIVREYKMTHLLSSKIDRTTPLPDSVKMHFLHLPGCEAPETYGDLAFLRELVWSKQCSQELIDIFSLCFTGAIENGFNETILKELK